MNVYLDLLILVLASFRLTRLVVYDTITEFLRNPFHHIIEEVLPDGNVETYIQIKGSGLRYWIGDLLSCHWCTGIWCSAAIYGCYHFWPGIFMPLFTILAMAGLASIIQVLISK